VRVGGSRVQRTDFRLISATWRDPAELFEKGEFREDLYQRIRQFEIHIPPLRERRVDIPTLAEYFLRGFCETNGRPIPRISEAFFATIGAEAWRGNVRELDNYVVRSAIMCDGPVLEPVVPPPSKERARKRRATAPAPWVDESPISPHGDMIRALEDIERKWIEYALSEASGNQRRAAAALGLKEATLRYKIRVLGIAPAKVQPPPARSPSSRRAS